MKKHVWGALFVMVSFLFMLPISVQASSVQGNYYLDLPEEVSQAVRDACGNVASSSITAADATKVEVLDLDRKALQDISFLSDFSGLETLILSSNAIEDISALQGLTKLQWLDLSATYVSDISPVLGSRETLTHLLMGSTPVTDLSPLSECTKLSYVSLQFSSSVSDIRPLATLANLYDVNLSKTAVTDLSPLSGNTYLHTLTADHLELADLTFLNGMTGLKELSLEGCLDPMRNYDWENDWKRYADAKPGEEVKKPETDLSPIQEMTGLQMLRLGNNYITDISALSGLIQLEELHLDNNQIEDLSPLQGMVQLRKLYLTDNIISDLSPLVGLTQLEYLSLDGKGNQGIQDYSALLSMPNLSYLDLQWNPDADYSALTQLANSYIRIEFHVSRDEEIDMAVIEGLTNANPCLNITVG